MLYKQELAAEAAGDCRRLAEHAALRALLNSYLRETGIFDPRLSAGKIGQGTTAGTKGPGGAGLHKILGDDQTGGEAFIVLLAATGTRIAGLIEYYSRLGQHNYGTRFYLASGDDFAEDSFAPAETGRLIAALLAELSFREPGTGSGSRCREMHEQVENSIRRSTLYLERALAREAAAGPQPLNYIRSEQSLLFGHPFHPTPKSSHGFEDRELERYAPELGASFSLHYMAVADELLREEWIGEKCNAGADVLKTASRILGNKLSGYKLLPLHPWQKGYLAGQSVVRRLLRQGQLVDLGAIGPVVYPTSSVRTVWDPKAGMFYKLPLHVRITNFIRENTAEQLRRTMDAALLLRRAMEERPGGTDVVDGMRILAETGYRTVDVGVTDAAQRERLAASFAVVYRQADALTGAEQAGCFVVAGLLETPPGHEEPLLFAAVRQTGGGRLPDWNEWLARYLSLSLLPLLRLYAETGISLEAHVQNSLLSLEQGWPARYYVRDLEGVSVNRDKAAARGWTPRIVPVDSPVLYEDAEAWLRLQYYFVVNHLGALIHAIGRFTETDEAVYWSAARKVLQEERARCDNDGRPADGLRRYVDDLLTGPELPAKANFISRFHQRGESPDYVRIPNPIYECGGSR
ncbi:IucA/IucC family protein [Paenibacillus ehimensis]|uniref:IucA/IucC family protein n=1 Tax=Paenibacillus ehimensis TaxID=79264 RepID=A0ABT8V7Q4_9BACL|nr:IucA/IucC family protein [Paenibacillus ehimensis]MDO3676492.1 IucA/IucC family protein [Paenibacillus ehimensis]